MTRRLLLLLFLSLVALAGCGSTHTTTTKPPAPPPLPAGHAIPLKAGAVRAPANEEVPSCTPKELAEVEAGHGAIGSCAPKPALKLGLAPLGGVQRGQSGPDVSNNDPFLNWHPVRAHGHPFAYSKVIQGTRFVDSTAAGMASAQRAAGVIPGGYDFLEVCRSSASGEARLYAARLKAIGLSGVGHAFVPMGDAEWPLSVPCSAQAARGWLLQWENSLHALIHRWPGFYTGAWWWNPNVGCWRPPHTVRWVSGYTSRSRLAIPCGWGGVDLWQYTNSGFNGVSHTDMSVLEASASSFIGSTTPNPKPSRRELDAHYALRAKLRVLIARHDCRIGQHARPRSYHTVCGYWLKHGQVEARIIAAFHAKGVF